MPVVGISAVGVVLKKAPFRHRDRAVARAMLAMQSNRFQVEISTGFMRSICMYQLLRAHERISK